MGNGGVWEVEAAGRAIKLMILWSKSPQLHTKMYASKQPNLLRKDLLTFNPMISVPALALYWSVWVPRDRFTFFSFLKVCSGKLDHISSFSFLFFFHSIG